MNRRKFLSFLLIPALKPLWSLAGTEKDSTPAPIPVFIDPSPIQKVSVKEMQSQYSGDQPHAAHAILWNLKTIAEQKAWPKPTETQDLVVIGGGVSGLLSAYFLKKHKPVILEQAVQFGGNSKGEQFGDTTYSIGAAYIAPPGAGSRIELFLKKIGAFQEAEGRRI